MILANYCNGQQSVANDSTMSIYFQNREEESTQTPPSISNAPLLQQKCQSHPFSRGQLHKMASILTVLHTKCLGTSRLMFYSTAHGHQIMFGDLKRFSSIPSLQTKKTNLIFSMINQLRMTMKNRYSTCSRKEKVNGAMNALMQRARHQCWSKVGDCCVHNTKFIANTLIS